jgi:hypothetical protein
VFEIVADELWVIGANKFARIKKDASGAAPPFLWILFLIIQA